MKGKAGILDALEVDGVSSLRDTKAGILQWDSNRWGMVLLHLTLLFKTSRSHSRSHAFCSPVHFTEPILHLDCLPNIQLQIHTTFLNPFNSQNTTYRTFTLRTAKPLSPSTSRAGRRLCTLSQHASIIALSCTQDNHQQLARLQKSRRKEWIFNCTLYEPRDR